MKLFLFFFCFLLISACDTETAPTAQQQPLSPNDSGKFLAVDYIDLNKIERISKFRSGIGHDYRDGAESCRSMKHYYQPKTSVDWSSVGIVSPVSGIITRRDEEWAGTQLWIRPRTHPEHTIIIFHIALSKQFAVGDTVSAGSPLGTHIGPQTMSDIAVGYSGNGSWTLLSYFDVMADSLFQKYQARGVSSRSALVISRPARDADPLNCSGEQFGTQGTLENWVTLK